MPKLKFIQAEGVAFNMIDLEAAAKDAEKVKEAMEGKTVVKVICVPGKLVNIVVK